VNEATTADCYPVTVMPGQSRLFSGFLIAGDSVPFSLLDEVQQERPAAACTLAGAGAAARDAKSIGVRGVGLAALEQGAGPS